MADARIRIVLTVWCFSLLSVAVLPAYAQQFGTGAFPKTDSIDTQLKRGASTKAEVQRLLGVPNGAGRGDMARRAGMTTPPLGEGPREIWFYDDIEITDTKPSGEAGYVMNLRQQILLVFFKEGIFDGYLWTTNAYRPTAQ